MQRIDKPDRAAIQTIWHQWSAVIVHNHKSHPYPCFQSRSYRIAKRCLDILIPLIGSVFVIPLVIILGLLIFLEDHRSIFYQQQRVGLHGRLFTTYKLRTMIVDADDYLLRHPEMLLAWEQQGKLQRDPRITRIGRFLRHSSLDELPQLLNIFRGEMTLVGPRPIQPSEMAALGELTPLRLQVKPGLTGLWQVSGRSSTNYHQRCVLDCIYIIECSFWADICILIKTIPVVFYGRGAC